MAWIGLLDEDLWRPTGGGNVKSGFRILIADPNIALELVPSALEVARIHDYGTNRAYSTQQFAQREQSIWWNVAE